MIIRKFDRPSCRELADKALAALKPIAAQFGLSVKKMPGSYTNNAFTMKMEFSIIDEEGVALTSTRRNYIEHCAYFNLKLEWLDKVFSLDTGESYKVTGLKPRSTKYPVLCQETGGLRRTFKFSATTVMRAMWRTENERSQSTG